MAVEEIAAPEVQVGLVRIALVAPYDDVASAFGRLDVGPGQTPRLIREAVAG